MAQKSIRPSIFLVALAIAGAGIVSIVHSQAISPAQTKSAAAIRQSFAGSARGASQSTVRIKVKDAGESRPAALGTVLSSDGWILTKGSEIIGHTKVMVVLPARDSSTHEVEAKFTGYYEPYDIAMLKVDATGLSPVTFADTSEPTRDPAPALLPMRVNRRGEPTGPFPNGPIPAIKEIHAPPEGAVAVKVGEFVITPDAVASYGKELDPKAYGVLSVTRRSIPYSSGVMGVALADAPNASGATVTEVFMKSGAENAGVHVDDIITAIDGNAVSGRAALQSLLRGKRPADKIVLSVSRGGQTLSLTVQLGDTILATAEDVEMDILSGQINTRSNGFPSVFQHDTVMSPLDMGGPLVDLAGNVIGINIARAGRTETYAIPADLLIPRIIQAMKDGDFPAPKQ